MIRFTAYAIAGVVLGYTYGHLVSIIELALRGLIRIVLLEV